MRARARAQRESERGRARAGGPPLSPTCRAVFLLRWLFSNLLNVDALRRARTGREGQRQELRLQALNQAVVGRVGLGFAWGTCRCPETGGSALASADLPGPK